MDWLELESWVTLVTECRNLSGFDLVCACVNVITMTHSPFTGSLIVFILGFEHVCT